ncbi:uncharacterized protein LOC144653543 [Oculina patagonica]
MAETGLAFSGGGIRSAAFCSGVLRRLLQRNTKIDYLSCVSGGGYTGTAYLDWKYRHGKKDDPKWHQEFFDYMRERAGLMCNWQKPLQGIFDTFVLIFLILLVSVVMPMIVWGSYVLPLAYAVDFIFGDLLRAEDPCDKDDPTQPSQNVTRSAPPKGPVAMERRGRPGCKLEAGSEAYQRLVLFATSAALFIIFYFLAKKIKKFRAELYFISAFCGLIFAFTFIPYYIYYFFDRTPLWAQLLVVVFSIVVWIFFPVLRRRSSFVVVVYLYSYAVYWKVYESEIFGVEYSDYLFYRLLFGFGIVLWFVPMLGAIQQRLVHLFNRWRLQKAFYSDASVGSTGCVGIGCEDIFLMTCRSAAKHEPLSDNESGPLSLRDLEGIKPQYLSNIVVNEWIVNKPDDHKKYELLIMSPTEVERLDRPEGTEQFENKLDPVDVDLSAAMATSAAAVARNMGAYDESVEGLKQLQTVLGLGLGASMVSDVESLKREHCLLRALPFFIEGIRILPLVTFPLIYFAGGDEKWVAIGVLIFFVLLLMMAVIATLKTGDENPGFLEKVTRWFIVHVPFVRFMRQLLFVPNEGPSPPPVLRLSDGGHIENLAILPLLKKRLEKIVVVDGGHKVNDKEWGNSLLKALSLAREKLHCSFIGLDGRDVIEDVKETFVNKPQGHQPRSYRFKVYYYEKKSIFEDGIKVGEGEVLLLSPRHPDSGIKTQERVTWKEALRDIDVDLEAGKWGLGPQIDSEEAERLTFCCCDCCHGNSLRWLSKALCGTFPQHITANQFFTPRMFSAYHSEGYNACVQAEAAEFLGAAQEVEMTNANTVEHQTGV